jgi:uncharacterized protein (TIGR02284 family)
MNKERLIDLLNELIEINKDSQEEFLEAAENVRSTELKRFFSQESDIRGRMLRDLQEEVLRLDAEPDWQGSVGGALERAWLDLKELFGSSDQSILASVEADEDEAVAGYERILKEPFPQDLLNLLHQQYVSIKAVHDHIRALRDSGNYKTKTV